MQRPTQYHDQHHYQTHQRPAAPQMVHVYPPLPSSVEKASATPYPHSTSSMPSASGAQMIGSSDHLHGMTVGPQRPASNTNYSPWVPSVQPESHSQLSTPPEAILEDLTQYITKDERYPAARGGFGVIWKCTCRRGQSVKKVAVKDLIILSTDQFSGAMEKKNKKIWRELKTCARLQHRNILPICGYTSGFGPLIAIVSPWADNGNLSSYLERSGPTLTIVRRFQILRDITDGLQYLHANNVIHADLNGPNVLIYGDGTACLADFGLSLELVSMSRTSWSSAIKGNLRWMAPELFELPVDGSLPRPSKESDIYSFGGIMLQVLTNKVPYYHLSSDAPVLRCIISLEKPSLFHYPEIEHRYWHFIEECWSAEPPKRPLTERVVAVIKDELDFLSFSTGTGTPGNTAAVMGTALRRPHRRPERQGDRDRHTVSETVGEGFTDHVRTTRWVDGL